MGYEEAKQRGRAALALLAECCKHNDEKGATELLRNTFSLLHVVYQAEVVRFLLNRRPGTKISLSASSAMCRTSFLTRRTLPSRNRPTPNGCAEIAHRDFAQKTLFRRSVLRTFAALRHSGSSWERVHCAVWLQT